MNQLDRPHRHLSLAHAWSVMNSRIEVRAVQRYKDALFKRIQYEMGIHHLLNTSVPAKRLLIVTASVTNTRFL